MTTGRSQKKIEHRSTAQTTSKVTHFGLPTRLQGRVAEFIYFLFRLPGGSVLTVLLFGTLQLVVLPAAFVGEREEGVLRFSMPVQCVPAPNRFNAAEAQGSSLSMQDSHVR